VGWLLEAGEAESNQARSQDDRAVHEGFEVVASIRPGQESSDEGTNPGCSTKQKVAGRPIPLPMDARRVALVAAPFIAAFAVVMFLM
jgi:hypothetical protein